MVGKGYSNIIKTDSTGKEEWLQNIDGDACCVQQTLDEGFIIVGSTESHVEVGADVYLVKINQFGNYEWSRTFGGSGYDRGESVQQTLDGGYIVVGYTRSYGAGETDVWAATYGTGAAVR